jgi:hypothetical protein
MPASLVAKTIAKVQTKQDKAKTASSLANLCTQSLWEQSIEAGKANELVAALRKSAEGKRALAHKGDVHTQTIIVNVVSSGDVGESYCGHVPLTKDSEFFFALLDLWKEGVVVHPLGGHGLSLGDSDDAMTWVCTVLESTTTEALEYYLKVHCNLDVEKVFQMAADGGVITGTVIDFLTDQNPDWSTEFRERLECLFDPDSFTHKRKPTMLTAGDLDELEKMGHPVKHKAVVTIDRDNWS